MPSTIHTAHQQYNAQLSNYNWWVYLLYLWRGRMPSQVCSSCTTSALLEDQIQTRKTLTLCSSCETCNIGKSSILLLLNNCWYNNSSLALTSDQHKAFSLFSYTISILLNLFPHELKIYMNTQQRYGSWRSKTLDVRKKWKKNPRGKTEPTKGQTSNTDKVHSISLSVRKTIWMSEWVNRVFL